MKILYEGAIGTSGGYAKDGVGTVRALRDRGHHVTVVPTGMQLPLPVDIAQSLSVENYQDPPYDMRITHQSPIDVSLSPEDADKATVNLWWSMWEWENYPDSEINDLSLFDRTRNFDWFAAYDSGTLAALEPFLDSRIHRGICQGGYEAEDWMPNPHPTTSNEFIFGALGDMSGRKNPVGLINAFRIFKDRNPDASASLIIKSRKPFLGPEVGLFKDLDYRIKEINGVWNRSQMEVFYQNLGAYVAPSYGEGKNLPALEAATNGIPLILSDIPGHRAWASAFDSVLWVGGERANLRLEGLPMWGLKVDEYKLADAMEEMYHDQYLLRDIARANVRSIAQSMDWSKSLERLRNLTKVDFL